MVNPSNFELDEKLGRSVSSRKIINRIRRRDTPPNLFYSRIDEDDLSVDRLHNDYLKEVTDVAKRRDENRGRSFYGWAAVSQEIASGDGRRIAPTPQEYNQFHASIYWPDGVSSEKSMMRRHAVELAANAHWQEPVHLV